MNKSLMIIKSVLVGIVLSILAGMPLIINLLPDAVSYSQSTQVLHPKPGVNRIGDIIITVGRTGKALNAKKINRHIVNRFSGFRDPKSFFIDGTPFFSLLAFCIFFAWYDKRPRIPYLLTFKRCVWGLFLFVSLWFTYLVLIIKSCSIQGLTLYMAVYAATAATFALGYCLHRYYHGTFKYRHPRVASLISCILEIRYGHYPRVANKALYEEEWRQETIQQIQEYEAQTFDTLGELGMQIQLDSMARRSQLAKFILIGLVLSALAMMPLLYQFTPRHVDYSAVIQSIPLKPGLNTIGDLRLTLSTEGKLLYATLTKRQIIHKVFGFKNLRTFLQNVAPFLSSLSLCVFSFWYEQQQKNPYVQGLKKYAFCLFLLVSLWFSSWALIPTRIPISQELYCAGTCILIGVGLGTLSRLCKLYAHKLNPVCVRIALLLSYVFGVSKRHYPRMAFKAMGRAVDYQETCADIQAFHKRTSEEVEKVKAFILLSDKLKREYEDFKRFSIDP